MSDRREERERLRQQRLASQGKRGSTERGRLVAGYVVAGILAVAVVVGLAVVIASGGDSGGSAETPDNANIDPTVGVFEGYEPDDREGTAPAEIQFGDLEQSAQEAGCELVPHPATHISSNPRIVPVDEANLSVSNPMR